MKTYEIRYEARVRGTVEIEAESEQDAHDKFEEGIFNIELSSGELVDWEATSNAKEVE